ncbi:MAG: penicillin-insensitive murein endopeptidase [Elusimicrobia bacterium]|nr:penicillin-insensitive murein endopeptidase [Elusimicrobiota bacterium]
MPAEAALLLKATLALSMTAGAATASLPDSSPLAPAGPPLVAPLPAAQPAPPAAVRELAPPPPVPLSPFHEALRQVQAHLKLIEAKGRSLSKGLPFRRGHLRNPAQLPLEGLGFRFIREFRNASFGTDDLISGLLETCARLKEADPEMPPLAVGDLSGPRGGRIALHRSHRNGRDADLVFFWTDEDGKPVPADEFVRFDARGQAVHRGRRILFDARRNWALVRELLTNPRFGERVKYIFVYGPLKRRLLEYAQREEGDLFLVEKAWLLLQQPGRRAGKHDNHFHLRITCSADELLDGCRDS